ncbi:GbpC/Spa domain-containing protein [Bulleidia sp. zg-1006]|uniref:GbpC/Spa domain-containing protein n=1 Tax=Bulleidia sp. zg-1006 TaxID=2806552 RepID=UPI001939D3BB|nr:GbpC/Spa domain-containing protein [Bulleidia sp. zg-1006]QRG86559.1 DUF11 domain-containing protein [Bulleidia sp. zg-1006]
MKSKLRIVGKKLLTIVMSCLMLFGTMSTTGMQAFAADSTKGIETNVDKTELEKAVKAAKDAGVPIKKGADVDKGVAKSKTEVDTKIAEIKKDYEEQIKAINGEIQKKKDCDAKQQKYEKLKKKYDQDFAQYEKDKKKYDVDMVDYNKKMAELQKKIHEDGYLTVPASQILVFNNEPNAKLSISGSKVYTKEGLLNEVKSWGNFDNMGFSWFTALNEGFPGHPLEIVSGDSRVIFEKGKVTTATYTNLQNSSINGVKISKVVFEYTLKSTSPLPNKIPAIIKQDPTNTIWYVDFFGKTNIGVNVKFFDSKNKQIDMTGALLNFSSLNRDENGIPKEGIERVLNFNGELIEIANSSIKKQAGNGAYSNSNNALKSKGSAFDKGDWDTDTSPNAWYGAIVGKATGSNISYEMDSTYRGNIWFALNSKVKAKDVPLKPVPPTKPTPPVQPQCPNIHIQANYHYDVLFYQPPVEKKVTNTAGDNINNGTVAKNSVVKFSLNVANLPAGHEKIESLVFSDKLPNGYEMDLAGTKQANSSYEVKYNQGTNTVEFRAKSDFIKTVNADLNKEVKITSPVIIGKVIKAGTTYKNDFDLKIDNEYSVKSKPVEVKTPPDPTEPKKDVFDTKGTTTSIDGKEVKGEDELLYKVTYKNTTGKAEDVEIKDEIPKYTKYVAGSADNGGKESGGVITWTKKALGDGETFTISFKVKVDKEINGKPVDNEAKVNAGENKFTTNKTHNPTPTDPEKEVFTGGTTTNIDGKAVKPGQELTYAVTYKNTTGKDVKATITDTIPAHTSFVSAENGGKYENGKVTWTADVAKGKSVTVKFTVKVNKDVNGAPVDNKAKINDGENEYDTNETHNPTPTEPKKEVFTGGTTTNIDGKAVKPEQELTYAISYKNTTGKDVKATITDTIPAHTSFVSAENGGQYANGKVTWTADVAKDKSVTVKFTVKVNKDVNGAPVNNKAKVNDGTNEYDTNETHNPTPTEPEKKVFTGGTTTNIDGKKVQPGQELTYAISYKNTTGEDRDVTITDKLPKHTEFVSADNNGKYENGMVKWTKKLANGESWTVKFTVKVNKDVNGATLTNTAKVNDGVNDYDTNTVKNPTPKTPHNPEPKNPHSPRTGDSSNIALLFMMLLASSAGLGVTYMRRKRV